MSYIDLLEQTVDRQYLESQAQKIKQSMTHETDYGIIEKQVDGFLKYVEAKSIIREWREAEKQGQTVSVDTSPAKKNIDELKKLLDGLGK